MTTSRLATLFNLFSYLASKYLSLLWTPSHLRMKRYQGMGHHKDCQVRVQHIGSLIGVTTMGV